MYEAREYIPLLLTVIVAVGGAFITVKVAIAELKKDNKHLSEKLDIEIANKEKLETAHTATMNEVRGDVKAIFKTLTLIQVSQAKADGRDEVLAIVRDSIEVIAKSKK